MFKPNNVHKYSNLSFLRLVHHIIAIRPCQRKAYGNIVKPQQDQIRLQVLKQNYARFSKGVGLPMQHSRMEAAGFDWKKGKAAEQLYKRKANAAAAGAIFVQKNDQLAINAKKIKPIDGFYDVVVHGDETGFFLYDGNDNEYPYTPREFAEIIKESKSYNGGSIRLVSCDTAAEGATSAQELADALGVDIMAPTKPVFVDILGEMTVGSDPFTNDGKWIILNPRG